MSAIDASLTLAHRARAFEFGWQLSRPEPRLCLDCGVVGHLRMEVMVFQECVEVLVVCVLQRVPRLCARQDPRRMNPGP